MVLWLEYEIQLKVNDVGIAILYSYRNYDEKYQPLINIIIQNMPHLKWTQKTKLHLCNRKLNNAIQI